MGMRTEEGESLLKWLDEQHRFHIDTATRAACKYTETDDPNEKSCYERYKYSADKINEIKSRVLQTISRLENKIPVKAE